MEGTISFHVKYKLFRSVSVLCDVISTLIIFFFEKNGHKILDVIIVC